MRKFDDFKSKFPNEYEHMIRKKLRQPSLP